MNIDLDTAKSVMEGAVKYRILETAKDYILLIKDDWLEFNCIISLADSEGVQYINELISRDKIKATKIKSK